MKEKGLFIASACIVFVVSGCHRSTELKVNGISTGDYAYVKSELWCMTSEGALDDFKRYEAQKQTDEMTRIVPTSGVVKLSSGAIVKVLEMHDGGKSHIQTNSGQECWGPSDSLTAEAPAAPSSSVK